MDTTQVYEPGDRVYRWWDSGITHDPQPLTIVRRNRVTYTVRTDRGAVFRMSPRDIVGYWTED
jgi:hypothetical protein